MLYSFWEKKDHFIMLFFLCLPVLLMHVCIFPTYTHNQPMFFFSLRFIIRYFIINIFFCLFRYFPFSDSAFHIFKLVVKFVARLIFLDGTVAQSISQCALIMGCIEEFVCITLVSCSKTELNTAVSEFKTHMETMATY